MELTGQKRQVFRKKTKSLRESRLIPAVIFGKGLESLPITVSHNDFTKIFEGAGETQVIDLVIEGDKHPVLVKDVQEHHITSQPVHIGFYEVNLKEKTRANIPVEVINEEKNELVKNGEAMILLLLNEVEVEALPTDLPEKFAVDAAELQDIDSSITITDLKYDREKVEILNQEPEEIVVKLDYAQMLEEEEEEEIDEAEALADIEATEEKEPSEEDEKEKPEGGEEKGSQEEQ